MPRTLVAPRKKNPRIPPDFLSTSASAVVIGLPSRMSLGPEFAIFITQLLSSLTLSPSFLSPSSNPRNPHAQDCLLCPTALRPPSRSAPGLFAGLLCNPPSSPSLCVLQHIHTTLFYCAGCGAMLSRHPEDPHPKVPCFHPDPQTDTSTILTPPLSARVWVAALVPICCKSVVKAVTKFFSVLFAFRCRAITPHWDDVTHTFPKTFRYVTFPPLFPHP